jgi:hypothetical protein
MQHLENIPGNSGPNWTGTFLITEDAGFTHGGAAGYTWQQVRDPADVSATDLAAQQRMAALNSHIETAYYQMPGAVNKNLPPPLAPTGSGGSGAGTGAGSGGAATPAAVTRARARAAL